MALRLATVARRQLHRRDAAGGDAYYIRPGYNAHVDEDVDLVEFTRADDAPGINTIET